MYSLPGTWILWYMTSPEPMLLLFRVSLLDRKYPARQNLKHEGAAERRDDGGHYLGRDPGPTVVTRLVCSAGTQLMQSVRGQRVHARSAMSSLEPQLLLNWFLYLKLRRDSRTPRISSRAAPHLVLLLPTCLVDYAKCSTQSRAQLPKRCASGGLSMPPRSGCRPEAGPVRWGVCLEPCLLGQSQDVRKPGACRRCGTIL